MTYRKVLRWMLMMILLGGISGAGYAFWLWNQSDEMLREKVLEKLTKLAPEWDIDIERARFDWRRRIHLYNITLKAKDHSTPIFRVPEAVVTVDHDKLTQHQQVLIHKIRLLNPSVDLVRDSDGHWNWQDLPKLPEPDKTASLPEFEIQKGNVRIRLEHSGNDPTAVMTLKNADVRFIPSAKRRFVVEGTTQVQDAGTLAVNGEWDFDEKTWSLDGTLQDVISEGRLLSLAMGFSPELRARIEKLDAALRKMMLTSSSQQSLPDTNRSDPVANLGVSATLDVTFHISCPKPHAEPEFQFQLDIENGQIANAALPFPLRDISGSIYWDNQKLVIQKLSSANGVTRIVLNGNINRQKQVTPGRFHVDIRNLLLDKRLYQRLPVHLQKYYAILQPSGAVDLNGMLDFDGINTWTPHNFVLTAKGCSVKHDKFRYKVQDILGEIVQRGNHLVFNLGGHAGQRPIRINGRIINPGPEAESNFAILVERLPIDDAFLAACDPRIRNTLQDLDLKGVADVEYHYYRPPGLNQLPRLEIIADLQNCSMECVSFKYRLTNLTGTVTHSSVDGSWAFHELRANHGTATVTGSGSFIRFADIDRLELNLSATNAQFEDQLKQALPVALQRVWEDFQPHGKLNVHDILIHWIPGRPIEITLPSIEISDASFEMRAFPLPITNAKAKLSYKSDKKSETDNVTIHSFSGLHDETVIRAEGESTFAANGDWRVRLTKLDVDDLVSTRKFRFALPEDLRSVFNELNIKRPISFFGMVEFKGTNDPADPVTAAWDLQTILTENSLTAGVDVEQASGKIEMRGTWDGKRVMMDGLIDLDSTHIWDHQFTQVRGPFQLEDTRLTVGTPEAFRPRSQTFNPASIPRKDRLTARAIGGLITLDADVRLQEETVYHVKMTLNGGRLEEYAKRYLPGVTSLVGMMTGEIELFGKGTSSDKITGGGRLQINPAALYELPVMLRVFEIISLGPAEKSAFTYALLNFSIRNERFNFNRIELVGNTISFFGKGTATFDGDLNLEFASELPPSQTIPIPFVSHVIRGATRNWVGISVTGNVNAPQAETKPIPQLDEALRKFFGVFEPRPATPPPRRIFPRFPRFRRPSSPSSPQKRDSRSR
jgi:hypothetical protein